MKRAASVIFCCTTFLMIAGQLRAEVIDFTTETRGPADTLQFGRLTVSADPSWIQYSSPSSVAGVGLGSAALGAPGTFDRIMSMSPAPATAEEGLYFSGAYIRSLTITPFFNLLGGDPGVFIPFDIQFYSPYLSNGVGGFNYFTPTSSHAVTITLPLMPPSPPSPYVFPLADWMHISLYADFGDLGVQYYLRDHPEVKGAQFGFSITSIELVSPVPESGPGYVLFGIVVLAIATVHRQKSNTRASLQKSSPG